MLNKQIKLCNFRSYILQLSSNINSHSPVSFLTKALSLSSSKTPTNDPSTLPPLMAMTEGTAVTLKSKYLV